MSKYRFADHSASSTSAEFGNYIIKRGMGEVRKPSWNKTETVIRILPQWDFLNNRWEPFRNSRSPMDFGDWIRRYDAVRGFGETGVTMLLYDPMTNPSYDIQTNPCVVLFRAIQQSIDARVCDPDWPALLKGGPGRRAPLSRHTSVYLVRCGIFRIKSEDKATTSSTPDGLGEKDVPYFMELPKTAGEKLIAMLEEPAEDYEGDPEDYNNAYRYGDIVSLDHGAYVYIFEEGTPVNIGGAPTTPQPVGEEMPVGNVAGGVSGGGGGSRQFRGYDLRIAKSWGRYGARLNSEEMKRIIRNKQRPWEDVLQFYDNTEQAHMIQDGFPPRAILYAWKDHPEWIKDETKSKAVARKSFGPTDPLVEPQPQPAAAPANGWEAGMQTAEENSGSTGTVDSVVPPMSQMAAQGEPPATNDEESGSSSLSDLQAARERANGE